MRVGIDARLVYYSQAGIGQYILHLVNGLAQVDDENEYILLQSRKDDTTILEKSNIRRVSLWTPSHHRFERHALNVELVRLGFPPVVGPVASLPLQQGHGFGLEPEPFQVELLGADLF